VADQRTAIVLADQRSPGIAALASLVSTALSSRSVNVVMPTLDAFTLAMSAAERRAYDTETPILDPLVEASADAVRRAHAIIVIVDTPSNGLPAAIKGWIDRVLVPGVAFVLDESTQRVRPALGHVALLAVISIDDRPRLRRWFEHDNARRVIFRALRLVCGIRTRTRSIRVRTDALHDAQVLGVIQRKVSTW
jgi:NAD(P)H dehydrogenase (quinone)